MRCSMFTATEHGPRNTPNLDSQEAVTTSPTSYAAFLYSCMSQQTFLHRLIISTIIHTVMSLSGKYPVPVYNG